MNRNETKSVARVEFWDPATSSAKLYAHEISKSSEEVQGERTKRRRRPKQKVLEHEKTFHTRSLSTARLRPELALKSVDVMTMMKTGIKRRKSSKESSVG